MSKTNMVKFCQNCDSLLYLRKKGGDINLLENYCKVCSFTQDYGKEVKCIMKTNYGDSDMLSKVNKFTTKDPSLPRLDKKCINSKCLTNNYTKNSLIIQEMDESLPLTIAQQVNKDIKPEDIGTLFTMENYDHSTVIKFKSESNFNSLIVDKQFMKDNNIEELKQIPREIVYMKYNSDDMQFLYICSTCKSYWFNFN